MSSLKNELYMQITKQTDTVTSTVRELQRKEIASHKEKARGLEALSARDVELADTRRQKACLEVSLETAHARIAALEKENGTLKRAEEKLKGDMQMIGEMARGHRGARKHVVEEIEDTSGSDESGTGTGHGSLGFAIAMASGDGSRMQKRQKASEGNATTRSSPSTKHQLQAATRSRARSPSDLPDAHRARSSRGTGRVPPKRRVRVTDAGRMQGALARLSAHLKKPSSATGPAAHAGLSSGNPVLGRD